MFIINQGGGENNLSIEFFYLFCWKRDVQQIKIELLFFIQMNSNEIKHNTIYRPSVQSRDATNP